MWPCWFHLCAEARDLPECALLLPPARVFGLRAGAFPGARPETVSSPEQGRNPRDEEPYRKSRTAPKCKRILARNTGLRWVGGYLPATWRVGPGGELAQCLVVPSGFQVDLRAFNRVDVIGARSAAGGQ